MKQFIKHYKLDSAAHTDAILYVTSLETTGQRGRSDKQQERKLLRRCGSRCMLIDMQEVLLMCRLA